MITTEIDRWLDAIAAHENRGKPEHTWDRSIGKKGEHGRWQFRALTWHQHTTWPFRDAHDPFCARVVARKHWRWIERALGCEVPYLTVRAWNEGAAAVKRRSGRRTAYANAVERRVRP